jgi:ubiquinol-cytochrome c reductase cytochrome b/c1 subunit
MTIAKHLAAFALVAGLSFGQSAFAAEGHAEQVKPDRQTWSFAGPFGKFDQAQLQRGFKVYREVCAACHDLHIPFRALAQPDGPGFSQDQVKALAAEYKVNAEPNEAGDVVERPARPSDYFPPPFPNDNAAKAANGGAHPPEMSLLAKARTYERGFPTFLFDIFTQYQEQGPDYLVGILTGYTDPPAGMQIEPGVHYNRIMPGHKIAMPNPLSDGQVEYTDGTPATVLQYAKDVTAFLQWAAEPTQTERKQTGFSVMVYLVILSLLLYYTKKKVWHAAHA